MKTVTKLLIAVLLISGLMPFIAGIFAAYNQELVTNMFHLTESSTPGLEKTIVILGASMIPGSLV